MAMAAGQRPPHRHQRGELPKDIKPIMNRMREEVSRMELGDTERERYEKFRGKLETLAGNTTGRRVCDDLDHDQFFRAAQKMHLPIQGLDDIWRHLECKRGKVNIDAFCKEMLDGNLPTECHAHTVSGYAKYVREDTRPAEYMKRSEKSLGDETCFMGSRGLERQKRAENWGKGLAEITSPTARSCNLNSSVHVNNQAGTLDSLNVGDFVIDGFRNSIIQRGGANGVHTLGRIFKNMGNRELGLADLKAGMKEFGVNLDDKSTSMVIGSFDRRSYGHLSVNDFVAEVRGPIPNSRRSLIDETYRRLDPSNNGLTMRSVQESFNARHYPDVQSGRLPEAQALSNFFAQFNAFDRDGAISRDDFQSYYKNVSAAYEDEMAFESMMKNLWRAKK